MTKASSGHGLEVLHIAHVLQDMLYNYVESTIWVDEHQELLPVLHEAEKALAELYQAIGNSIPDEEVE